MRQFLWGVVFGTILFPLAYIGRLWLRRRSDRIDFDDTEWP
jgi:hypothetical protein